MVAVFIVVSEVWTIITVEVAAQDSLIQLNISCIRIQFTKPGIATFKSYTANKLECGFPVTGVIRLG